MGLKQKIKNKVKGGLRLHNRMILIYIIGGMLPFIAASLYTNAKNQSNMIKLNKNTQESEIEILKRQISEPMTVAVDVLNQLYVSSAVNDVTRKTYDSISDFENECNARLGIIDRYLSYYKRDISDIKIFVDNKPISANKYFFYLGDAVKTENWYKPTIERNGDVCWNYGIGRTTRQKHIQVTRAMKDKYGKIIAVLCVQLQNDFIIDTISDRSMYTVLLYNDSEIIYTNYAMDDDTPFLAERLKKKKQHEYAGQITVGVEDYLLVYNKIYPRIKGYEYEDPPHFTITTIERFQDLTSSININSLKSYTAVIVGLFASVILILVFSKMYSNRMELLRKQMHYVAIGEYDKVTPIEGTDEVAELYKEVEKMRDDNRELMQKIVEEQVQKEKIHTKQREVEFKMLASQINPHFLYNTLETIRMKAKINKEPEIEELVKMLAKIMRRNIQVSDKKVTLKSEVQLIEYYLKIQNYRFGDRIHSQVIVDDDVEQDAKVLPLIIQPFVENAFVHGLESSEDGGNLTVHVSRDMGVIVVTIEDDGVGMDYYQLGKLRYAINSGEAAEKGHIGVSNVNQRLKLQYGEQFGVTVDSTLGKGTKITIMMPFVFGE